MAEARRGRPRKKKVEPTYTQNYGHGAGAIMRMKKNGFSIAEIREFKRNK